MGHERVRNLCPALENSCGCDFATHVVSPFAVQSVKNRKIQQMLIYLLHIEILIITLLLIMIVLTVMCT